MKHLDSKRVLALTAGLALAVGAGGAIAASKSSATRGDSFLARVAGHLGISTEKLQDATKAAAIDQVDADLKAGRITKAQADVMKARIQKGEVPLFFGGPHRFGDFGHHGMPFGAHEHLSATADYLGLSVPQLVQKLANGESLADIAKAQNKSVDGLKKAILDSATKAADRAVKDGVITEAQAKEGLKMLESRLDDIVNGSLPRMPMERRGFHWRQGPPDRGVWDLPGATDS
jgi:hypothetical protein